MFIIKPNNIFALALISLSIGCNTVLDKNQGENRTLSLEQDELSDKIKVLNLGSFHMGYTLDANTVDFDEQSKANHKLVHAI